MLLQICTRIGHHSPRINKKKPPPAPVYKQQTSRSTFSLAHGASQGHQARDRCCQEPNVWGKVKRDPGRGTTPSGGARKLSQNFSNLCDSVCSLKCIHLRKRALSSSLSQYNAARPASEWHGAAAHTGYSRAALASDSND